jgi:CBS domain containing-hemolysin-like protein
METEAAVQAPVLTARDLVRGAVVVVAPDESVDLVWSRLQLERCDRAVVVGPHGWLGVVELQDLWVRWATAFGGSGQVLALVSPAPVIAADTPLLLVCRALSASARGIALVTSEVDGSLLGVLTTTDVVRGLTKVETT